jgi:hypothetical protein
MKDTERNEDGTENENIINLEDLDTVKEAVKEEIEERKYMINPVGYETKLGDEKLFNKEMNEEGKEKWQPKKEDEVEIQELMRLYPKLDLEMATTLYMADKNGELEKVMAPDYVFKHHKDEYYTEYIDGQTLKGDEWCSVDNTGCSKYDPSEKYLNSRWERNEKGEIVMISGPKNYVLNK